MKRMLLILAFSALWMTFGERAEAKVFPSYIRITQDFSRAPFDGSFADRTGMAIRFILNQPADSVQVAILPTSGGPPIKVLTKVNLGSGDNYVTWDGSQTSGSALPGTYKFQVTAFAAGYSEYTVYHLSTPPISTRGITTINNPNLRNFGFTYGVSYGTPAYDGGVVRHASSGQRWGNAPDTALVTTTGVALTSLNRRYSPTADREGYIYVIGLDERKIYRFHTDTLVVSLFDSSAYGMRIQGLDVEGSGAEKVMCVTGDSAVFYVPIGTQSFNTVAPTKMITASPYSYPTGKRGLLFWDAKFGADSTVYVVFRADTAVGGLAGTPRGVMKFDMKGAVTSRTIADTVWTTLMKDGDPVTIALWHGQTPADDILYMSHDLGTPNVDKSGIYAFTNLNASAPTRNLAWLDPDNNASSTRSGVAVDALGNIVYFENSNEQVVLISPPSGPNSYSLTSIDSSTVTASGSVKTLVTIGEARIDRNGDRQPDRKGDTLRVIGVINSVNIQTTQFGYFMQDSTGGIEIFSYGLVGAPAVGPGYRVMVTGAIDIYRGTTEIVPANLATDIVVLDTGNVIVPIPLTMGQFKANAELYESRRIQLSVVQPLSFTSAQWPAAGASANLTSWDGIDTLVLRIDSDTEVDGSPYPTFPAKVTGVATQYTSSSARYDDGYQITPMFISDFVATNAPPVAKFALLSPPNGSRLNVDTSSTSSYKISWRKAIDFNNDPLLYQFQPVGGASAPSDNSGADTVKSFTSAQLRALMGSADSLVLKWTVLVKDATHPPVACRDTFTVTLKKVLVGVEDGNGLPTTFQLAQNFPNPFNPSTTIRFALPMASFVTIRVYDVLGREVATLMQDARPAGYHDLVWNGRDRDGLVVASGVYFYRIEAKPEYGASPFTQLKKMLMLK